MIHANALTEWKQRMQWRDTLQAEQDLFICRCLVAIFGDDFLAEQKVRCRVRQAYGYHDLEYFKLKIYDLPDLKIQEVQSPRKRTIPKPRQEASGATAALTALALEE